MKNLVVASETVKQKREKKRLQAFFSSRQIHLN
jgi:hypothetical protein